MLMPGPHLKFESLLNPPLQALEVYLKTVYLIKV